MSTEQSRMWFAWREREWATQGTLIAQVAPHYRTTISHHKTAAEMWKALMDNFGQRADAGGLSLAWRAMAMLQLRENPTVDEMIQHEADFDEKRRAIVNRGGSWDDEANCEQFLLTLPIERDTDFKDLRRDFHIEAPHSGDRFPFLEKLYLGVMQRKERAEQAENDRRGFGGGMGETVQRVEKTEGGRRGVGGTGERTVAAVGHAGPTGRTQGGGGRGPVKCYVCDETGHIMRFCPVVETARQTMGEGTPGGGGTKEGQEYGRSNASGNKPGLQNTW
ncbi:hypothetical protein B9479_000150 [Cryptococcus floricola]|uniref:CCHC-type domain-containing protein n=1 Tax=Cryptococcus floricola TaxID=2591691 RepID=A0A5D3B960_9TREE|nr:hypothetical protein B9479_000150 [Cryptococcus floricola]